MWPVWAKSGDDGDAEQAVLDLAVDLVVRRRGRRRPASDAGARDAAVDGAVVRPRVEDVDVAAADADVAVREVEDARACEARPIIAPRSASVRQSPRPM